MLLPACPTYLVSDVSAKPRRPSRHVEILKRRASLGPNAYVFGSPAGEFVANFKTAWESLLLMAKPINQGDGARRVWKDGVPLLKR
jgi:hypothetical protein